MVCLQAILELLREHEMRSSILQGACSALVSRRSMASDPVALRFRVYFKSTRIAMNEVDAGGEQGSSERGLSAERALISPLFIKIIVRFHRIAAQWLRGHRSRVEPRATGLTHVLREWA